MIRIDFLLFMAYRYENDKLKEKKSRKYQKGRFLSCYHLSFFILIFYFCYLILFLSLSSFNLNLLFLFLNLYFI